MAGAVRLLLGLLLPWRALAMTAPDGCSESAWTMQCLGIATCESLAEAGVTCGGVMTVPGCATVCAEPCCITTTTTTQSFTSVTMTTATSTVTSTSQTVTMTSVTSTMTSITTTETQTSITNTSTSSTASHTKTSTMTMTHTSIIELGTSLVMTTAASTGVPTTSPTDMPSNMSTAAPTGTANAVSTTMYDGPTERLVIKMRIIGVLKNLDYITDSRVSTAYREAMMEVTSLPGQMIDLQMVPQTPGNLTVSYILNIPEASTTSVEEKVKSETPAKFGTRVAKFIDMYVGAGVYTQEVVSIAEERMDFAGVSAAVSLFALRSISISVIAAWLRVIR